MLGASPFIAILRVVVDEQLNRPVNYTGIEEILSTAPEFPPSTLFTITSMYVDYTVIYKCIIYSSYIHVYIYITARKIIASLLLCCVLILTVYRTRS